MFASFWRLPPPAILAIAYLFWVVAGAGLLMLPMATTEPISWSSAIFTATSAATVTGLAVLDTGSAFTGFGQAVIVVLIQLGGMGLMTFAVLVLSSLGLHVGLAERRYLRHELGVTTPNGLLGLTWIIFRVVILCELVGALVLGCIFVPEFGWSAGSWHAVFHSVSAFNNAGFSLFSDNLAGYSKHPLLLFTIAMQFIVGGLGFAVLIDICIQRDWRRFSLHSKLMLTGTICLTLIGVLAYGSLEWNNPNTLGQFSTLGEKLSVVLFEAVTPRTAGFNVLDTAALEDSTSLVTMFLMLIGGGAASTAGGIKVTTFLLLLFSITAFIHRSGHLHAFGYSMGTDQTIKVMALLSVSLLLVFTALLLMLATQEGSFLDLAFETVSAFGTVGLSRGVTGDLDTFGRALLCVVMFMGRIGPLTLGFMLATKVPPRAKYPEGAVYLG